MSLPDVNLAQPYCDLCHNYPGENSECETCYNKMDVEDERKQREAREAWYFDKLKELVRDAKLLCQYYEYDNEDPRNWCAGGMTCENCELMSKINDALDIEARSKPVSQKLATEEVKVVVDKETERDLNLSKDELKKEIQALGFVLKHNTVEINKSVQFVVDRRERLVKLLIERS